MWSEIKAFWEDFWADNPNEKEDKNMSVLNKVAEKASVKYGGENAVLDPATVSVFVDLIFQFIAAFQECRAAREAHQDIKSPGLLQRIRARQIVRENMSRKDFRQHGDSVLEALFETGRELTVEEVEELYKEV